VVVGVAAFAALALAVWLAMFRPFLVTPRPAPDGKAAEVTEADAAAEDAEGCPPVTVTVGTRKRKPAPKPGPAPGPEPAPGPSPQPQPQPAFAYMVFQGGQGHPNYAESSLRIDPAVLAACRDAGVTWISMGTDEAYAKEMNVGPSVQGRTLPVVLWLDESGRLLKTTEAAGSARVVADLAALTKAHSRRQAPALAPGGAGAK
jgi:hypothetical protein